MTTLRDADEAQPPKEARMYCRKCDQPTDGQIVGTLSVQRDPWPRPRQFTGVVWHLECLPVSGPAGKLILEAAQDLREEIDRETLGANRNP